MTDMQESTGAAFDDLRADLDGYGTEPLPDGDLVGTVTDDLIAAAYMQRLRGIAFKRSRVAAMAQAELDRVEAWASERDLPLRTDEERLRRAVEDYVLGLRARHPNVKSLATPFGTIKTRETPPAWDVSDEDALLAWARGVHPEWVKTTEKFATQDAKRKLTDDGDGGVVDPVSGEQVPGLKVRPAEVKASVSVETADQS